jgi:hypothetical protein
MRRIIVTIIAILSIILFNSACSKEELHNQPTLDDQYQSAVADAIVADSTEICDTLWPVSKTNPKLKWKTVNEEEYVLVGNFNKYPGSYSGTSVINSWGMIWVFIPEQYKSRMKAMLLHQSDTLLRMSQLLGLPPGNNYNYIVELWVKPEDLFRPSADPEIDDKTAGQYLPSNADTDYVKWFNKNIYDSYFTSGTHYPWTRLGYTYDWAKTESEVGVSEYCIKTNSEVYVEKLYVALKYLNY